MLSFKLVLRVLRTVACGSKGTKRRLNRVAESRRILEQERFYFESDLNELIRAQ